MGVVVTCAHGLLLGECPSPTCPTWLGDPTQDLAWVDGWALSDYSAAGPHDTRLGHLVHTVKYADVTMAQRVSAAEEIAERLIGFIAEVYEPGGLPFTAVVTAPPHGRSDLVLATWLCQEVAQAFDLIDGSAHVVTARPTPSMKTLPTTAERQTALRAGLAFTPFPEPPTGVLFVDDVFQTGATAQVICQGLASASPIGQCYVLTATRRGAHHRPARSPDPSGGPR